MGQAGGSGSSIVAIGVRPAPGLRMLFEHKTAAKTLMPATHAVRRGMCEWLKQGP
jgi:hypothetical protein